MKNGDNESLSQNCVSRQKLNTNKMLNYCTYFDSNYLSRGLALFHSLKKNSPPFTYWVLCLDLKAYEILKKIGHKEIVPVLIEELEKWDYEFSCTKTTRSIVEYYFTASPCFPRFVLKKLRQDAQSVIYLDSDLYFFSSLKPVLDSFEEGASVLLTEHRFLPHLKDMEKNNGKFNVGLVGFRNNEQGLACLDWWRERCIEWCYDRVEPNRFADQKYLDEFPKMFSGVKVLGHEGCNLAPWNVGRREIVVNQGIPYLDGKVPVIFYHFHGVRILKKWLFEPSFNLGDMPRPSVFSCLYRPYIGELSILNGMLNRQYLLHVENMSKRTTLPRYSMKQIVRFLWEGKLMCSFALPLAWLKNILRRALRKSNLSKTT